MKRTKVRKKFSFIKKKRKFLRKNFYIVEASSFLQNLKYNKSKLRNNLEMKRKSDYV